jgi:hypothetical protein
LGITPGAYLSGGYNGNVTVASVIDATQFTYALASDPGTVTSVTNASCTAGVTTITTSGAHGLAATRQVTISGISPSGYNGAYTVASVVDATHFTYGLTCPAAYVSGGTIVSGGGTIVTGPVASSGGSITTYAGIKNVQATDPILPYSGTFPLTTNIHVRVDANKSYGETLISAASWSAGTVTITTPSAHRLQAGQRITISGYAAGTYSINSVPDTTHLTFALAGDPGAYGSGGSFKPPAGLTVASASRVAAGSAWLETIQTSAGHGFVSGQPVTIAGVTPTAYNGTYRILAVDPTHVILARSSDPGAYTSGGTLTAAVALTLKAYVASTFASSLCYLADFQNLARDLSALCAQNPTIQQNNVYMNDTATGKALAKIFAGFTNAQGSASASEQTITLSDFMIRTE